MSQLIEVAFKGNRKEFYLWDAAEPPPLKAAVIVEADRGEDLGYVYATGELAEKRVLGVAHRPTDEEPVTRAAQRLATPDDIKRAAELREQDEAARRKAIERVKANNLTMKLSDAEWRWDRRKLTIYFTAEKRVDFRNLVRELASMFHTRIELKQIGVRDEAKRLGGIGRCAREYCSASWLPELRPVNLGVAKDQRLSLNPTQISGACGRLMCCLRYEHEFYVSQRKRFPKEGRIIETSMGEEKVVSNDIFRERVTLRNVEGELRLVPLAELRREWKNPAGATDPMLDDETPTIPYEAISDEVLRLQDTSELPAWRPDAMRDSRPRARSLPVMRERPEEVVEPAHPAQSAPVAAVPLSDAPVTEESPEQKRESDGRLRRRRGRRGGRRGRGGADETDSTDSTDSTEGTEGPDSPGDAGNETGPGANE